MSKFFAVLACFEGFIAIFTKSKVVALVAISFAITGLIWKEEK